MKMAPPHFTSQPVGFKILLEYDWRRKYRNVFSKMLTAHFQAHKTQKQLPTSGLELGS